MPKGSTVFAQIMSLIPRRQFNNCVARYNGDYRIRNFSCYDQFLVMIMAQYANKNSLRDIEASLTAISHKLYHSGISYAVPRNTLAKADVQGQFFVPVQKMPKKSVGRTKKQKQPRRAAHVAFIGWRAAELQICPNTYNSIIHHEPDGRCTRSTEGSSYREI